MGATRKACVCSSFQQGCCNVRWLAVYPRAFFCWYITAAMGPSVPTATSETMAVPNLSFLFDIYGRCKASRVRHRANQRTCKARDSGGARRLGPPLPRTQRLRSETARAALGAAQGQVSASVGTRLVNLVHVLRVQVVLRSRARSGAWGGIALGLRGRCAVRRTAGAPRGATPPLHADPGARVRSSAARAGSARPACAARESGERPHRLVAVPAAPRHGASGEAPAHGLRRAPHRAHGRHSGRVFDSRRYILRARALVAC